MKIAVLGAAGRMGSLHAKHLAEMGHEVRGFDITDPQAVGSHHGIETAIAGTDGVVIASPAACHLRHLRIAVAMDKHVFVEKPICLIGETDQCRQVLAEADSKQLAVAVGYNLRFHPLVMRARQVVERPRYGSFVMLQKPKRPLAHFLEEWASHEVDLALHLMGPVFRAGGVVRGSDTVSAVMVHGGPNLAAASWSAVFVDAISEPPVRKLNLQGQLLDDQFAADLEFHHVQDAHYYAELQAWTELIESPWPAEDKHLATGWDGLAAIQVLEEIAK